MKRIGRILFCLLPLILTIILQNLVTVPICGITAMAVLFKNRGTNLPFAELINELLSLWSTAPFVIFVSMTYAIAALFIFGYWYRKKFARSQERVAVRSAFNPWIVFSLLLLSVGLQYVISYLMNFIGVLRPDWMQSYTELIDSAGIGTLSPLMLFYALIVAPISEELVFRGVTLGYAKKALPVAGAVCLQAVLFGIFHLNMIQGIYAAFLGLFIGYLHEAGGSVVIPMLFHAFFNSFGTLAGAGMFYHIEQPFFFLLWLTVGVLLTYAGIFLFQHGIQVRDFQPADHT
ncbi:MAG: CPBP family intramembrane metalloprotease [Eubacterium sp.]|nr:CPBP family intramembrane metalloprotease [Eubacterium sp.]